MITLNLIVAKSYQAILAASKKVSDEQRFFGDIVALTKEAIDSNDFNARQCLISLFSIGLVRPICNVPCPPFTAELLKPERALEQSKHLYRVYRVDYEIEEEPEMKKETQMGPTTSRVLVALKELPNDKNGWTPKGSVGLLVEKTGLSKGQVRVGLQWLCRNGLMTRRGSTTAVQYHLEVTPTRVLAPTLTKLTDDSELISRLKSKRCLFEQRVADLENERTELQNKLEEIDKLYEALSNLENTRQKARELLKED